jgi:hypothetical protein
MVMATTPTAPLEKKAQKAFGLLDTRDMLQKLRWELRNLFSRQRHDIAACQYHAFNCAVTAWHATDWLWHDISSSNVSIELIYNNIKPTPKNIADFQRYIQSDCPSLRLCHQIANGSKHCLLERNPDSSISANISGGEGYEYGNPIIDDGETRYMADKVFYDALFWFEKFIQKWNIFPDAPFVSMGDLPD